MPIVRYRAFGSDDVVLGIVSGDRVTPFAPGSALGSMRALLQMRASDLARAIDEAATVEPVALNEVQVLAPVDAQEVWAAGVTYRRSRDARMEESSQKDVYDLVYDAERPEIFLKATPQRVVPPGEPVAIRSDSTWDVPEPELALVLNRYGEIVGFTVGNDMSSRSIEGENPLYLPQAKIYDGSASLGPVVVLASEIADPRALRIELVIERGGAEAFRGETSTEQIHRSLDQLASYLFRGSAHPDGAFLMTGTGIVPPDDFTLQEDDVVHISIEGIGTLTNPVRRLDVG
jgi:2-dehydro-3-deoxy-D-arabinonate dehydratase